MLDEECALDWIGYGTLEKHHQRVSYFGGT